jgi:hypothetical protein
MGNGPSSVQMGVTANQEVGYLGVFTKADIGLKNGNTSDIFVSIDGNLFKGVATSTSGELKGGYSGGYILTDDPILGWARSMRPVAASPPIQASRTRAPLRGKSGLLGRGRTSPVVRCQGGAAHGTGR